MALYPSRCAQGLLALALVTFPLRAAGLASPAAYGVAARRAGRARPAEGAVYDAPKTSKAFLDVTSQLDDFEHSFAEARESGAAAEAVLKVEHHGKLEAQRAETTRITTANRRLASSIEELRSDVAELRRRAGELQSESGKLKLDIRLIQTNISTGREFVLESLKRFDVSNASEFLILAELDDEDKAREQDSARTHRFSQIQAGTGVSLLDVSPQDMGSSSRAPPKELLDGLEAGLEQLGKEQRETQAALNATFEKEFQAGAQGQEALLLEQESLSTTQASLEKLRERLKAAVAQLEHSTAFLRDHLESLHAFLARTVGHQTQKRRRPAASLLQMSAPSLLQMSAADVDEQPSLHLPAVHDARENFSFRIDMLRTRVERQHADAKAALSAQHAEYLAKLEAGRVERQNISEWNANLSNEISHLQRSSAQLQATAFALVADCDSLSEEARALQANLSAAQEFAEQLLENTSAPAPELDVLRELAEEREKRESEEAHEERLRTVAGMKPSVSLLAFGSAEEPRRVNTSISEADVDAMAGANASGLMRDMGASLEALAQEESEQQLSLQRRFEDELRAGASRRADLDAQQALLLSTRSELVLLQARLEAGVSTLKGAKARLQDSVRSLRHFVVEVGGNNESASPAQHQHNHSRHEDRSLVIDGKVVPAPSSWVSRFSRYVSPSSVPAGPL